MWNVDRGVDQAIHNPLLTSSSLATDCNSIIFPRFSMTFCTDVDLLNWEPNIFRDAGFASQTLLSGSADLSGTTLTIAAGSLADSHVSAEMVVVLAGAVAGSFPIVSVDSATVCTVSIMHDRLFADDDGEVPSPAPVGTSAGLTFTIRTFFPQRRIVSELLRHAAGIDPGADPFDAPQIVNPKALRRACMLGTLQMIYNALAAATGAPDEFSIRAGLYQQMYQRAVRSTEVQIDLNNDGLPDERRLLNVLQMVRR
jgi:hypothetical protein